jgi:hypothetical protein
MLEICRKLFCELNVSAVEYCSWKGNDHLEDGLYGRKDLDILVNKADYFKVNQILSELRFRRFDPQSYLKYLSVEDFIGLDEESGHLVHIHLYYEIRIGRRFIEDYHLPFEEYALKNRIFSEQHGLYLINPSLEVILFLIRYIAQKGKVHGSFSLKMGWYNSKLSAETVGVYAAQMFDDRYAEVILTYLADTSNRKKFGSLRLATRSRLRYFRTSASVVSGPKVIKRTLDAATNYLFAKSWHLPFPYRRVNPSGGLVVAFVGVDGSGKSTLVKEINKWLSWKIDIFPIYFGSGDGHSSLARYPLLAISRLVKHKKPEGKAKISVGTETNGKERTLVYQAARTIWAIMLAFEKQNKLKQLWVAKNRGLTVLCDRYPQYQTVGFNDGPLLGDWLNSRNYVAKKIAHWELRLYQLVNIYPPDILIKLKVPEDVALKRKPEMELKQIRKKSEAINRIQYHNQTKVYEVDTAGDLNNSLAKIKQIIWN